MACDRETEAPASRTPPAAAPGASAPELDTPPHVLLVGTDRRFRSVVAALLARRGCIVSVAEEVHRSAQLATADRVDVVVLDAGAMPALAALQSARLEALRPSIGMVVVSEHPVQAAQAPAVLPKWGSFDGLYDAIVLAGSQRPRSPARGPGD